MIEWWEDADRPLLVRVEVICHFGAKSQQREHSYRLKLRSRCFCIVARFSIAFSCVFCSTNSPEPELFNKSNFISNSIIHWNYSGILLRQFGESFSCEIDNGKWMNIYIIYMTGLRGWICAETVRQEKYGARRNHSRNLSPNESYTTSAAGPECYEACQRYQ